VQPLRRKLKCRAPFDAHLTFGPVSRGPAARVTRDDWWRAMNSPEGRVTVHVHVDRARAALDVAEQAKSVGPLAELEAKVLANPLDHQARFDFAIALNAKGKREEAAQQLLEIVKRDRKWSDDGARKQLVQFFEAWGFTDPAAVEGRKKLSSILFA